MKEMKFITRFLLMAVIMLSATSVQAKDKDKITKDAYLFGMSASFSDSTVYITDIQKVYPAYFAPKTKFLYNRDGFSSQLKAYMKGLGVEHPTCITFYSQNKKKLEKKYAKIKRRYDSTFQPKKTKKKKKAKQKRYYNVKYLTSEQFSYMTIAFEEGTVYVDSHKAEKAARKSMKKEQKEKKSKSK